MAYQTLDIWTYREGVDLGVSPRNVVGYDVEARDGSIGKVDEATFDTDSSSLVVDTGPWIFGKKVMLPAGVIRSVDHADEKSLSTAPRTMINHVPELDVSLLTDRPYRDQLGSYYGRAARASSTGRSSRSTRRANAAGGFLASRRHARSFGRQPLDRRDVRLCPATHQQSTGRSVRDQGTTVSSPRQHFCFVVR